MMIWQLKQLGHKDKNHRRLLPQPEAEARHKVSKKALVVEEEVP